MKHRFVIVFLLFLTTVITGCIQKEEEPELIERNYDLQVWVRNEDGLGEYPLSSCIIHENTLYIKYEDGEILYPRKNLFHQEFINKKELGSEIELYYCQTEKAEETLLFKGKWPSYTGKKIYTTNHPITISITVNRAGDLREVWLDEAFKGFVLERDYERKKGMSWVLDPYEAYQQFLFGKKPEIYYHFSEDYVCISEILPIIVFPVENQKVIVPHVNIDIEYQNFSLSLFNKLNYDCFYLKIQQNEKVFFKAFSLNHCFFDSISEDTKLITMFVDLKEKRIFLRILSTSFQLPERGWQFTGIELIDPQIIEIMLMEWT